YDVIKQIETVQPAVAERFRQKFGDAESQRDLSAVTHIARGKSIPPFLVMHVADNPETRGQSELLVKALREAGIPAKAYSAEDTTHVKLDADLGKPDDKPTKTLFEFVDRVLNES